MNSDGSDQRLLIATPAQPDWQPDPLAISTDVLVVTPEPLKPQPQIPAGHGLLAISNLALAGWFITGQPIYLGLTLLAALLTATWGFGLATSFARSNALVWLLPVMGSLNGLSSLILLMVGAHA